MVYDKTEYADSTAIETGVRRSRERTLPHEGAPGSCCRRSAVKKATHIKTVRQSSATGMAKPEQ